LALSSIVRPPQVLTALAAPAFSGSTAETDRATIVARTAARTMVEQRKIMETPSFETLRRTLHHYRRGLKLSPPYAPTGYTCTVTRMRRHYYLLTERICCSV
jgi:hypothetical protein